MPDRLFREAWEACADGLIVFDTRGRIQAFDRKFAQLTAVPVTDAAITEIFPPDCRPLELLAAANPSATRFCELTVGDGRPLPVRCECVRVRDGLLVAIHVEPARAATDDRPEWFDALLNATDAVILVLDGEGRFIRFNGAAEVLTGFSAEEVIGTHFWNAFIFDEDVKTLQAAFQKLVTRAEGRLRMENRWRMRDGSARILSWSNVVARDRAGKVEYVVSTAIDVTAIRRTERALASLSGEFMEVQAAGRHDICSYLHDTISQNLLVLGLLLGDVNLPPDPDRAANMEQALRLLKRCCQDLRVITYALAPPVFEELDPSAAFDWYSRHLRDDARVDVEFRTCAIPHETSPEVRTLLLAAIQEWAQKAIRYPGAARTFISLKSIPLDKELAELQLEVACSEAENEAAKAVLASPTIRERVQSLGGRCETFEESAGIRVRISVDSAGVRI